MTHTHLAKQIEIPNKAEDVTLAMQRSSRVLELSPLRYNKLNEGSGSAIVDSSVNNFTGTYTGITWDGTLSPFGEPVPFWDGTSDYGNLYSAAFGSAFNLNEGFVLLWVKVSSAALWADGTFRRMLTINRDGNNRIAINKSSATNFSFLRAGNGTVKSVVFAPVQTTDWFCIGMSWSIANDQLMAFVNGVQVGTTQTGNVAAIGSGLSSTEVLLGAQVTTPAQVWSGYLSQFAVWTSPKTDARLGLMAA